MEIEAILEANEAFYRAFRERNFEAMDELWSAEAQVACIHPGWRPLSGREAVMASWRGILKNPTSPQVRCEHPRITTAGEMAFVVCCEDVGGARMAATNIYVKEGGRYRIVHHAAGPIAPQMDVSFDAPPTDDLN